MGSVQSARRIQHGGKAGGPGVPDPLRGTGARALPGPRRAHFLRGGAPRPAPGRLGRLRGGRWPSAPAEGVTAPLAAASPCPRGRGRFDRLRALPRAPAPGRLSGRAGAGKGGRGPLLPARLSTGADCAQCAPTASCRRAGRPTPGARGLRRCRLPTRPVLKHGPRSLTRARVGGQSETLWRNEGEGRRAPAEVGSRRASSGGRTTGPSRPLCRGGGA